MSKYRKLWNQFFYVLVIANMVMSQVAMYGFMSTGEYDRVLDKGLIVILWLLTALFNHQVEQRDELVEDVLNLVKEVIR